MTIFIIAAITAALLCVCAAANEDLSYKNGTYYTSSGTEVPGVVSRGIDVSTFQKEIDWDALREEYDAGRVDFVIIRCGYGDDFEEQDDYRYYRNVEECVRVGIPFGIYLYSYADSVAHAESELRHVLRLIDGYEPSYPVFYDLEDKVMSKLTAEEFRGIVDVFCGGLHDLGYETGVYSMRTWYTREDRLGGLDYNEKPWLVKWIAEYNPTLKYTEGFDIWQATSKGSVGGISADVDVNYSFLPKRQADHCYVTFDINTNAEVGCDLTPMHLRQGDRIGWLPRPVCPTKKFLGWYTSPTGGARVSENTVITAPGRLRLYARWGAGETAATEPAGDAPGPPDKGLFSVIRPMISEAPFSVNGLTNLMEYRVDGGPWLSGNRIRAVRDGQTVEVRFKATAAAPAGQPLGIYVHTSSKLNKISLKSPTCVSEGIRAHWRNGNGRVFVSVTDYFGYPDTGPLSIPPTGKHTYRFSCSEECTVCGQKRTTVHSFPEAWERAGGYHWHVCSVCGKESDHTEHSAFRIETVAPGCVTFGRERTVCADCGMIIYSLPLSPLGHVFDAGRCVRCGEPDAEYVRAEESDDTATQELTETAADTVTAPGTDPVPEPPDGLHDAVGRAGKGVVIASSAVIAACVAAAVASAVGEKKTKRKNDENGDKIEK
ncbi:MAG: hypothetical protein IJU75_04365 [Clostridia bacterium]|nr:hypothetical protein [Clostridia bacterium]